ncbi:serine/threonine-protein phosphatase with EF-hands 1-like [Scleropages formosus]|uniref:Serine/threonine-protein phosphatase n=1 Tax=Scleropages formosus TaxID=113540 RepID=A0A0P7UJN3_SCLFO|nr:serine/threonine-protein phosphatase with EF-hands 1-like [Scleropages formosus]
MGCGTSVATENQGKISEKAMKAAVLIQRWYRRYIARLEMRRRYTWSIFQSIEYAGEQEQLQLSSFFSFMLDNFTQLSGNGPDLISNLLEPEVSEGSRGAQFEGILVSDSYCGPRLSFPLTVSDTNALLGAFKAQQTLHARYLLQLLHETKKFLKQMPNIIRLSTSCAKEITICGDLHGRLDDLLLIFYKNGLPSTENPYVFNGDFVDRGKKSVEILVVLFAFLLVYPDHMHLNRGNHEDHIMNLRYGFTKEVMQKYRVHGREILRLLQDIFSLLPLATIIDDKVLIVHGGISNMTDLDFVGSIERHKAYILQVPFLDSVVAMATPHSREEEEWKQVVDLLWSDPKGQNGCTPNTFRGGGCYFGPDVTRRLLQKHGLRLLVITIFSASNYYEEGSNRGAYLKLGPDLVPRFFQYQVSRCTRKLTLHQRVSVVESSALKALKEKLFAHRSELMTAFQQYDEDSKGYISTSDWAKAMESVLRLDLPWRTLRPRLARLTPDGSVEYQSCFEDVCPGQPTIQISPNLAETLYRYRTDLEIIFNIIDKDHSGLISIDEFRQTWKLFSSHLNVDVDDRTIEDLARTIDFNKDGSIDFNEFLEAFRVVHKLDGKEKQQG